MKNKMIHIIRPIENSAEKEYIKEFFRFIGCFISDWVVDVNNAPDWGVYLQSSNEYGGVDVVLNYFGSDPYAIDCKQRNIKRIYCYFDFEKRIGQITEQPLLLESEAKIITEKPKLRSQVLSYLINAIWENESETKINVQNIASVYLGNLQGDLFYLLQAKRCLRVLGMGEVLKEPSAQVARIPLVPYIGIMLRGFWQVWVSLGKCKDPYSIYARTNAANMTYEIMSKLYESDYSELRKITFGTTQFHPIPLRDLIQDIQNLIKVHPQFASAYLLLACLFRSSTVSEQSEAHCYLQMLQTIRDNRDGYGKEYAFVLYRVGYFYEKKCYDTNQALAYYKLAVEVDPGYYQALFKLGYYAAAYGQFNEAELWLNRMIQSIFHGKSTEPNVRGEYENWLALSLKESQYIYKAYVLLAKIALNCSREYSIKAFVGKACLAATRFEEASLVRHASALDEGSYNSFMDYHRMSTPVWSMWQVLKPWSEDIIHDFFVRDIVRNRLSRWKEI